MQTNSFSFRLIFLILVFPGVIQAQQSRLRQSVTRLSTQIARKMDANHHTRIVVLDFNDLDGNTSVFGKYLAETLITDLFDSGKFQVVERRLLIKVLEENKLKATGLIDPATVKKLGQMLGADAIVSGTTTDLASHVAVNARLVATDTAAVFGSASEEVEKDEDVRSILATQVGPPPTNLSLAGPTAQTNSVEQAESLFVVKSCVRRAERISCSGSVTNKASKARQLVIGRHETEGTSIVDDGGNSFNVEQASLGQLGASESAPLMPELPMNFFVAFSTTNPSASKINLIIAYHWDYEPWQKALFRNILLSSK
jgi:curli biogenesis system outer membrane secretion channel CsgG